MEAVAASVIAVVGTLLGAGTTHLFQLRAARRAERFARVERLRDERIDAYAVFAGALADYRRGRMDHWFARNDDRGATDAELHEMRREAQRLRATAMEAMFRAELLTASHHLAETGRRALKAVDALGSDTERSHLAELRTVSREAVYEYVAVARVHVPGVGEEG
ncbi:hypothetical protein [Streptomyces sulphureus]|uniref:hypothetical protein n=1 Tax=Streptomyces sulphureus TaxID=47758 RepID=UPI0003772C2F|nr:hypothetical protein [Streptomyces sulphureus]